jgi:Mg2+/Co2+ transporter CorB
LEYFILKTQLALLVLLLLLSAFFSSAETSLMSLNRHRLRHLAKEGRRGAKLALNLINKTDILLSAILLGNTFAAVSIATLSENLTYHLYGSRESGFFLGTIVVTFIILIFGEITPKVIAAAYAERLAFAYSFLLYPLIRALYPVIWLTNMLVTVLLRIFGIRVNFSEVSDAISTDELRSIVSDAGQYIPQKNRAILLNLFDLEYATVDDVMTAHTQIESVDLDAPFDEVITRISSSNHTRLLATSGEHEDIVGVIHIRRVINLMKSGELDLEKLKEIMNEPYFIPSGTPLFTQIHQFQEKHERLALIVDEYGELKGLLTLEDILEEIIGEFTTQSPLRALTIHHEDGGWMVDGTSSLRDLNKKLGLDLPLDGPKTLNGLILERFEDIPEVGTTLRIGNCALEITQTQDKVVKSVRVTPILKP